MNAVFNIYKPAAMTSNDVVAIMRKILNMKKIGHGGTLDPDATGVLPVFTGAATRLLEFAVDGTKEYVAEFRLGTKTNTGDISGAVVEMKPVPTISQADLEKVFQQFLGKQQQIPPMFSAIKMEGKKLYQLARKGQEVERQPRQIEIYALELLGFNPPEFRVRVECSKGTYIRTLGEDLAAALGTVGTMTKLTRTRVGQFELAASHTLDEIRENPTACVIDPLTAVNLPHLTLTGKQAYRITSGVATTMRGVDTGRYVALGPKNEFLGIVQVTDAIVKAEKILVRYENPEANQ